MCEMCEKEEEIFDFFGCKPLRAWHLRVYMDGRKETKYWVGTDNNIHELLDWLRKQAEETHANVAVGISLQGIEELDNGEWREYYNSDGYGADELLEMYVADINEYMSKFEDYLDFLDEGEEITLWTVVNGFEEGHIVHPGIDVTIEEVASMLDEDRFEVVFDGHFVVRVRAEGGW